MSECLKIGEYWFLFRCWDDQFIEFLLLCDAACVNLIEKTNKLCFLISNQLKSCRRYPSPIKNHINKYEIVCSNEEETLIDGWVSKIAYTTFYLLLLKHVGFLNVNPYRSNIGYQNKTPKNHSNNNNILIERNITSRRPWAMSIEYWYGNFVLVSPQYDSI